MITKFKVFESEIYVGTNKHFNPLKPVNVQVLEEPKLFNFQCNSCFFQFSSIEEVDECSICGSNEIDKLSF
jgi:hypothetical protein